MERKTMGSFIAALRKANGMTQKALAERLNVSDKAVSRWERDENAPDLSLIPVIAEIFGVTADELLRGERADPSAGNPARAAEKREREIRRLAASVRSGFCIQSIISAGIALAGLVAAMILNFGFLRAYAGFFAACIFLIGAAVCETAFLIRSLAALTDSFEDEAITRCRKSLLTTAEPVFSLILILFTAVLPLILLAPYATVGLSAESWLKYGLLAAAGTALLCLIVCLVLNLVLSRRGGWESEGNRRLLQYVLLTLGLMALTLMIHLQLTSSYMPYTEGIVFQNYTEFIDYMEQTEPDPDGNYFYDLKGPYYDANGAEITRREHLTETVRDPSGQELFRYLRKNLNVASISFDWEGSTLRQIKVCTWAQAAEAQALMQKVSSAFYVLYALELGTSLLLYLRRKKK